MKIFISYTIRDKQVTENMLKAFAQSLTAFGKVYIDLLDNDSEEKQARLLSELHNSDLFLLIESREVYSSPWVQLEIKQAKLKGIKIHSIPFAQFKDFCDSKLSIENLLPI
jgi:hypothetical protein